MNIFNFLLKQKQLAKFNDKSSILSEENFEL